MVWRWHCRPSVVSVAGKGMTGEVDGRAVAVGSPTWMVEQGIALPELGALLAAGRSVVAVAVDGRAIGLVGVADPLRGRRARRWRGCGAWASKW